MPRLPSHRTSPEETAIQERRRTVASLYLRNSTQWEIARKVGCDQKTVSRDLAALRVEWKASAAQDFSERQAQELAKIDRLERVAWKGWQRSRRNAQSVHVTTTKGRTDKQGKPLPDLTKRVRTARGQAGDPRFLERVAWCIEQRCVLLGLTPEKGRGGKAGGNVYVVSPEFWERLLAGPDPVEQIEGEVKALP
jgi:hypothetical protein